MGRKWVLAGFLAVLVCFQATGCGRKDESISKKVGRKLGESVTDFGSGVGTGFDAQMTVNVELTEDLAKLGVSSTMAKSLAPSVPKTITVYLITQNKLEGTLVARALNGKGLEIGRARTEVTLAKDDAQYVNFAFPSEMDTGMVVRYEVGLAKP